MKTALAIWREDRGLKPIDAAKMAEVTLGMWSRWENGKRPVPPKRCVDFEAKLGIPRHVLRPDIFEASQ